MIMFALPGDGGYFVAFDVRADRSVMVTIYSGGETQVATRAVFPDYEATRLIDYLAHAGIKASPKRAPVEIMSHD